MSIIPSVSHNKNTDGRNINCSFPIKPHRKNNDLQKILFNNYNPDLYGWDEQLLFSKQLGAFN